MKTLRSVENPINLHTIGINAAKSQYLYLHTFKRIFMVSVDFTSCLGGKCQQEEVCILQPHPSYATLGHFRTAAHLWKFYHYVYLHCFPFGSYLFDPIK